MPIKKAAIDYLRYSKKRQRTNRKATEKMRNAIKKTRTLVTSGDAKGAAEAFKTAQKIIDKTAQAGVIKKQTAARYKTRLAAGIRKITKKA